MSASRLGPGARYIAGPLGLWQDHDLAHDRRIRATGCGPRRSRRIAGDEYDKKARELKERQTELAMRIEQRQKGEGEFRTTLESLISVTSRAAGIFERSKIEQKRQLTERDRASRIA
jgi:hypothetical protein